MTADPAAISPSLIPVLALADPAAGAAYLQQVLGFRPAGEGRLAFGAQEVALSRCGQPPAGLVPMRLDHVAFRVGDADRTAAELTAQGGRLAPAFTPDGPLGIAEFWDWGVRFVFLDGPEGWPFEFCARNGQPEAAPGHDHYAIRAQDLDGAEAALTRFAPVPVAQHLLDGPVRVRFLAAGGAMFELFDEAGGSVAPPGAGWIGLLDR